MIRILFLFFATFICIVTANAQLTGIKTIGGATPDYATFTLAIAALNTNGVGAGGVTFNVRNGTYTEAFATISSTVGASASNPIVFQSENLDSTAVTWTSSSSSTNGVLKLTGTVSFVT